MSSLDVIDEVGDVEGHLRGGSGGSVVVLNESVNELLKCYGLESLSPRAVSKKKAMYSGHPENHVVEIGVEGLALGDIDPVGGLEVVPGEDVVDVVHTSGPFVDLGEIGGPDSSVGVFGLFKTVRWEI